MKLNLFLGGIIEPKTKKKYLHLDVGMNFMNCVYYVQPDLF